MSSSRIKALDGFRAVAVLGVLWAHIWMFYNNPPYELKGINIAGALSFFGTGVDLFFVISGFCMYLMYSSNQIQKLDLNYYGLYLKKRWLRIAPAFYVAILVYCLDGVDYSFTQFDWTYALKSALFIKNIFLEEAKYGPHFWSLCTEWHFYLVLPVLIIGINKMSFRRFMIIVVLICLIIRIFIWIDEVDYFNVYNFSIPNRLIEFISGIVAARIYLSKKENWFLAGYSGFVIGILITLAGRMLMSSSFHYHEGVIGIFSRVMDKPVLSMGYGLLIVSVLNKRTIVTQFLETNVMASIGKYSYSMYLWHWIIASHLSVILESRLTMDLFWEVNITFLISILLLYPLSKWSYQLLEAAYFKNKKISTDLAPEGERPSDKTIV